MSARRLAAGMALAIFLRTTAALAVGSPAIRLLPSLGPPTSAFTLEGQGFAASEDVLVRFAGVAIDTVQAGPDGSFAATERVPADARPGRHVVAAEGHGSGLVARRTFLVRTDWTTSGFDGGRSGFNPYENVVGRQNVWRLLPQWSHDGDDEIFHQPVVAGGMLYGTSSYGTLYAYDADTGVLRWSNPDVGSADPAVGDGLVFVGNGDGLLQAYDARSGVLRWSASMSGSIGEAPIVDGQRVFALARSGQVASFEARTGSLVWTTTVAGSFSALAKSGDHLLLAGADGNVYALDAGSGAFQWTAHAVPNSAAIIIDGGRAFVTGGSFVDGRLTALDVRTGTRLWSTLLGTYPFSPGAAAYGMIYEFTDHGLVAFDAATGTTEWTSDVFGESLSAANGVIYAGHGVAHAVDARTGELLWTGPNGADAPAVIANGMVFLQGSAWGLSLDS